MTPRDLPEHGSYLLEQYYSGDISASEREELLEILGVSPEFHTVVKNVRDGLADVAVSKKAGSADRAYARLLTRIANDEGTPLVGSEEWSLSQVAPAQAPPEIPPSAPVQYAATIRDAVTRYATPRIMAATFAVAAVIAAGVVATQRFAALGRLAPSLTYVTENAQRREIDLPDGTHVTLNVASELSIPADFANGQRTVQLRGEAYFSVAHAEGSPFVIKAANRTVRVLGTEFAVRAYDTDDIRIAVRTGRVTFERAVLGQNDVAHMNGANVVVAQERAIGDLMSFTEGRLVLTNVPLRDAIPQINRWYGTNIRRPASIVGNVRISVVCPEDTVRGLVTRLNNMVMASDRAVELASARAPRVSPRDSIDATSAMQFRLPQQEAQQMLNAASQRESHPSTNAPRPAVPVEGNDW